MTFGRRHFEIRTLLLTLALTSAFALLSDDKQANVEIDKAAKAFAAGDFRGAAKAYQAAELYADSPDLKLTAIQKAAESFGKAGLKYKQFLCLKKQIAGFADKIDFAKTVEKEYAIGNEFMKGHRDVTLSWLPWIKEPNRAVEIYETILKQVPFAKFAPTLKLRLGRIYIENGNYQKALTVLRGLIREHPKSKAAKYGRFELANALVQLAGKAGDGDGAYAREAEDILKESLKLYPNDPETQWLKESKSDTDAVRAERLFKLADFYESRDNKEAAVRYYHDLLARFPDSEYAAPAEKRLAGLDDTYKPRKKDKAKKGKDPYPIVNIPGERGVMLVTPEASGGKWLLPVEDFDLKGERAEAEHQARKKAIAAKRERERRKAAELKAKREAARKRMEARRKAEEARKAAEAEARGKEAAKKAAKARAEAEAKLKKLKAEAERKLKEEAERKAKEEAAKKAAAEKRAARARSKKENASTKSPAKPKNAGAKGEKRKSDAQNAPPAAKPNGKPVVTSKPSQSESGERDKAGSMSWLDILLALLAVLLTAAAVVMLKKKKERQ